MEISVPAKLKVPTANLSNTDDAKAAITTHAVVTPQEALKEAPRKDKKAENEAFLTDLLSMELV